MSSLARNKIFTTVLLLLLPVLVQAAELVNINTANSEILDTLPGIGPAKATAIVDYRTANGPFARIEDIQLVTGIGPAIFADIQSLITVGEPEIPAAPAPVASTTQESSPGSSAYVEPPSAITVEAGPNKTAVMNSPVSFVAVVKARGGNSDFLARVFWNFGDGSSKEGNSVDKIYKYTGTYLVSVTAIDGDAIANDELTITIKAAETRMLVVPGAGVLISNDSKDRLDLSYWRLTANGGSYTFPRGTILLPQTDILFPYEIIGLDMTEDAALLYPDGTFAARNPLPVTPPVVLQTAAPQLILENSGSNIVQTVESADTSFDNAILSEKSEIAAPSAMPKANALGAAVASAGKQADAAPPEKSSSGVPGLLKSPWTYGLLGVVLLAGAAFIFI